MANETTATTAAGGVNSSFINPMLQKAARDKLVAVPLCAQVNLAGKGTKTAAFVSPDADAAADITDGTAMSNSSFTLTQTTIAVGMVGLHRSITLLAERSNVFNIEEYLSSVDGPAAIAEEMDTDVMATYANASTGVSDTTVNADYADFLELIALHNSNLGGPGIAFCGHPRQVADIVSSVLTSTAGVFANASAGAQQLVNGQQGSSSGFRGMLLDIPLYQSTQAATANAAADVVGALVSVGSAAGGDDSTAATGFAYLWMPEARGIDNTSLPGRDVGITACYGTAEILDRSIVSLTTDAP